MPSRSKKNGFENIRIVDSISANAYEAYSTQLINNFNESLKECEQHYIGYFSIDVVNGDSVDGQFLRYAKGHKFTEHTDQVPERRRVVSCIYYFNSDYTGGELNFSYFDLRIKPQYNSYMIFPSIWSYSHSAAEVIDGEKYAYVKFLI